MELHDGDCLDVLPALPEASADSCVTDPPYGLGFMGKQWDAFGWNQRHMNSPGIGARRSEWVSHGGPMGGANPTCNSCGARLRGKKKCRCPSPDWRVKGAPMPSANVAASQFSGFCSAWAAAVLRVLKPGAYLLAFGGTRTYHRLTCAIEDAGFEVRDCLMWLYGTGFPKGKGCLKPGYEPIVLARKPGGKVLPLGIDGCRIPCEARPNVVSEPKSGRFAGVFRNGSHAGGETTEGRWPANVVIDDSDEVLEAFAAFGEKTSGKQSEGGHVRNSDKHRNAYAPFAGRRCEGDVLYGDSGSAARFFYCAKASKKERGESNTHPTVKPLALMRWLVRLVTPPGGVVLDPFAGSGTTALAARAEGRHAVLIEREPAYRAITRDRLAGAAP